MTHRFPLCFEMCFKNFVAISSAIQLINYEILLKSLTQVCDQFVFSLRHVYIPSEVQKIRSFILINPLVSVREDEIFERVNGLLTRGNFSRFCDLTYKECFPNLDWVGSIGEVLKHGEFVEQPDFVGYLPHFFATDPDTDAFPLLELLKEKGYGELVLEFSLETYNSPDEQSHWSGAVKDLVSRLSKSRSRNDSVKYALELYGKYQDKYSRNQLFNYSLKALGRNAGDTFSILQTLIELSSRENTPQQINPIITLSPKDPNSNFESSLKATQNVQLFKGMKWNGWEREIGKRLEQKLIKATFTDGLLDDGTYNFPILSSSSRQSHQASLSLPSKDESLGNPDISNLVLGGKSSFLNISEVKIPKVEHLKPLHYITTYEEVVGFFKIFQPPNTWGTSASSDVKSTEQKSEEALHASLSVLEIRDLVREHEKEITEDTYIVGIESDGSLCVSDWEKCPHRLIAGTPGAGKTNFLFSLIYQLLYTNPCGKIYLADFQAGLHFHIVASQYENIEMVTQLEDFAKLLKGLDDEHGRRRELMIAHKARSRQQLQQKSGKKLDRIFLIIDEAFFIQNADNVVKKQIEKHLTTLASQARATGIHIVYCSQSPNLLNKEIKACFEERVVFRVANNNESLGLLDNFSALGLEQGMAVHRGISYDSKSPKIVKVPFVPDEVWDSPIR